MICDIIVNGAQFEVGVQATKELLFQNEIYQPGAQQMLQEQASFDLQDCEIHSLDQANDWVSQNTERLQSKLAEAMRSTLVDMGWQILWVKALSREAWQICLEEAEGKSREEDSLIQLPRK